MKVLFVLTAVLLATAQASFFTEIGNTLATIGKTLGQAVLHELDTTGVDLLNAGVAAGKQLVSQGVQALALNTANALENKDKTTTTRDLHLPHQFEATAHNLVDTFGAMLKSSLGQLSTGLQEVAEKAGKLEITPDELTNEVDKLVGVHNLIAEGLLKTIETKAEKIITSLMPKTKRNAAGDFFKGVGASLASLFQPMVDNVKNLATSAGSAIKAGGTALLSATKESIASLGTKLQPHLQNLGTQFGTMVQHGSEALSALKAAGGDILQQTMQNMKEPLNNIAGTLTDAGKTVAGHVAGTLLGGALPTTTDAPSTA